MARTRYTATGNNEDNTNTFVPPSFSFPIPSLGHDGEIVVFRLYTEIGGEYTPCRDRWIGAKLPI